MNCPMVSVPQADGTYIHTCQTNPNIVRQTTGRRFARSCDSGCELAGHCATAPKAIGAGGWMSKLLREWFGIVETPDCPCKKHARTMDQNGPAWCRANIAETIKVMGDEAAKRGLVFIESQMRWLIELAISLSEGNRTPTLLERGRLQAMAIGNRVVNGKPS